MDKYISVNSKQYFAFNVWSIESAKAIMDAASQKKQNVILQTSMKVFEQIDQEEFAAYVRSYEKKKGIKAYLHLDHCRKKDFIYRAMECGWDSVMIDASDKTLKENIQVTNEVTDIVKKKGILVEAEVGQIYGQEDGALSVETGLAMITDVEEFIRNTNVDMLAAAIGTVHGLYKGTPRINYNMISEIAELTDIPFVVHGGTGLSDENLLKLLTYNNVKKINISTDVKLAYKHGIEESIAAGTLDKERFDPLSIHKYIHASIQNIAAEKMRLLRKDY